MPPPAKLSAQHEDVLRRQASAHRAKAASSGRRRPGSGGGASAAKPVEFKVIVLGDSGVGKSSVIRQFVHRTFDDRLLATVGCDFSTKTFSVDVPVASDAAGSSSVGLTKSGSGANVVGAGGSDVSGIDKSSSASPSPAASSAGGPQGERRGSSHAGATSPKSHGSARASTQASAFLPPPRGLSTPRTTGPQTSEVRQLSDGVTLGPQTRVGLTAFQIWDTAGGERHNALGAIFFRGADACILVYDVTKPKSFAALEFWADEFAKHTAPSEPVVMVVANKTDLPPDQHVVPATAVKRFCENRGFLRVAPDIAPEAGMSESASDASPSRGGASPSPSNTPMHSGPPGELNESEGAPLEAAAAPTDSAAHEDPAAVSQSPPPPPLVTEDSADVPTSSVQPPFTVTTSATSYGAVEPVFALLAIELLARRDVADLQRRSRAGSMHGNAAAPADDDPVSSVAAPVRLNRAGPGGADGGKKGATKKKRCDC